MKKSEYEVIGQLLKLYPDVVEDLGGESVVSNNTILEKIKNYIESHKWFVNKDLPFTITLEQAFFSWHENVFLPQWNEMVRTNITRVLNHLNKYEIFKLVSDEYYYQAEKDPNYYYNKACYSVINRESKSIFSRGVAQLQLALIK